MKKTVMFLLYLLFISSLHAELITNKLISDAEKKYKAFGKNRFVAVRNKLIEDLQNESDIKKLNTVNTWINGIKYKSDKQIYGVSDYWATMYEFVGRGKGDCEDYTIAKYYILKELGISPERMKFTYVIYRNRRGKRISHMVLAYLKVPKPKKKKDILILDNNNRLLLTAAKRDDLVRVVKMINGDTGAKSQKWKKLETGMQRKKL